MTAAMMVIARRRRQSHHTLTRAKSLKMVLVHPDIQQALIFITHIVLLFE
jgi:hypothetical protein